MHMMVKHSSSSLDAKRLDIDVVHVAQEGAVELLLLMKSTEHSSQVCLVLHHHWYRRDDHYLQLSRCSGCAFLKSQTEAEDLDLEEHWLDAVTRTGENEFDDHSLSLPRPSSVLGQNHHPNTIERLPSSLLVWARGAVHRFGLPWS